MDRDGAISLFEGRSEPGAPFDARAGRHGLLAALAGLLIAALLIGAAWLAAPRDEARRNDAPARGASTAAKKPPPLRAPPEAVRQIALVPALLPQRKLNLFLTPPGEICDALGRAAGDPDAAWSEAPVEGNGWECLIGPVSAAGATDAALDGNSLFAVLRGSSRDDITQFSLKLSLLKADEGMIARARAFLAAAGDFGELRLPAEVEQGLLGGKAVTASLPGAKYRVSRERTDAGRVNLVAAFTPVRPFDLRPYGMSDPLCCRFPHVDGDPGEGTATPLAGALLRLYQQ